MTNEKTNVSHINKDAENQKDKLQRFEFFRRKIIQETESIDEPNQQESLSRLRERRGPQRQ